MPLTATAQALFDHAKHSLPTWLTGAPSAALEWLNGFTQIMDTVRSVTGQPWLDLTYILNATGADLDQHAADRGTSRRAGESDITLRERLRNINDQVTEPAIVKGVTAIIDGQGIPAVLNVQDYTTTGWTTVFDTTALKTVVGVGQTYGSQLSLQTINDGTNPPTFTYNNQTGSCVIHFAAGVTTRAAVDAIVYPSQSIVVRAASASGATVLTTGDVFGPKFFQSAALVGLRRDRGHMHASGSCRAFLSRGYRMTGVGRPMAYILILPYLTDAATANAVSEYLRQNGPAGYLYYVERRINH